MDWRSVTFDWNRARAVLVTAEEGSLSAAARALGVTQPTLGRQVAGLEEELDVILFERVGRSLQLTETGRALVEQMRAMGDAATQVSLTASGQAQSVEGRVTITAAEVTAAYLLPGILGRLRAAHPRIVVDILASNALTDLRRREADIAVRGARPTDPDLIGRKISSETAALYASRDFMDREGPFASTEDLAAAPFIGFEDNANYLESLRKKGLPVSAENFPLISGSHIVHWELARAGHGIGIMPCRIGDMDPTMQRVADWFDPFEIPVWLVAHREVNTSRRVRLVFDYLAEEMGAL
ncbi:MAG: LysR family transcriptional regulator [Pseudomonadota bacterium]